MTDAAAPLPGNEHAVETLHEVLRSGEAIALVGAGASAGLYPMWSRLLENLADEAVDRGLATDGQRTVWTKRWANRPLQAVEGIRKALGRGIYGELLQDTFGPKAGPDGRRFTPVHELLVRLPFRGIVTTNYDAGLVEARTAARPATAAGGEGTWQDEQIVNRWLTGDAFQPDTLPILFAHGVHNRPPTIVLGAGEYRAAYREGPFRTLFEHLWSTRRLVIVGFGFADPWWNVLIDEALTKAGSRTGAPRHIALVGIDEGEPYDAEIRRAEQDQYHCLIAAYRVLATDNGPDHGRLHELLSHALAATDSGGDDDGESTAADAIAIATDTPSLEISPEYQQWVRQECADVELLGMRIKEGRALRLTSVYVPLNVTAGSGKERDEPAAGPGTEAHAETAAESEAERHLDGLVGRATLLSLLDAESLFVSGPPGAGKSTFCRWAAGLCCAAGLPRRSVPDPEEYAETFPESLRGRLPVLVPLREFWPHLPQRAGSRRLTREELEQSLGRWAAATRPGNLEPDTLQHFLDNGRTLLILDGVDEVPLSDGEDGKTRSPRAQLLAGVNEAADHWDREGNRLLVTSRPYGLDDSQRRLLRIRHVPLSGLDRPLQELLTRRWFAILADDPAVGERQADDLLEHLAQRGEVARLVDSPLLLTAICIIYHEGKRLPQDTYELYYRIVDIVLYGRFDDSAKRALHRNRLCVIAHAMHTGEGLGESRDTPRAEATFDEVDRALASYQEKKLHTEEGFLGVTVTREQLLSRSGLLLPKGDERAGFYHLSIQEFLAALRLLDLSRGNLPEVFRTRAKQPEWRLTLSFLFGSLLARSEEPDQAIELANQLVDEVAAPDSGLLVVLADCLEILRGRNLRLHDRRQTRFLNCCVEAIELEVELADRMAIGLALGRLGDPRIIDDLRDPRAYVLVRGKADGTGPATFLLSRFLVTNGQFARFIDAGGYEDRQWWTDAGWEWLHGEYGGRPLRWDDPKWNGATQPVVGTSYYAAEAFCKWAGGFLPSEEQWELAARGPESDEYPWGADAEAGFCNSEEAGLNRVSPVGIFPRARGFGGLEDMAGNAYEWIGSGDGNIRPVRGGAYFSSLSVVVSGGRVLNVAYCRNVVSGFRIARTNS